MDVQDTSKGTLKVWWVPQMPCKAFEVPVPDLETAMILLDTLGAYDAFQFENKIKPDYCNAGGLLSYQGGEWVDWYDEESGMDFDDLRRDPDELARVLADAVLAKTDGAS